MKPNTWQRMFGAKRRATDRALLAALEREITAEEKLRANPRQAAPIDIPPAELNEAEKRRIARAFGRPN